MSVYVGPLALVLSSAPLTQWMSCEATSKTYHVHVVPTLVNDPSNPVSSTLRPFYKNFIAREETSDRFAFPYCIYGEQSLQHRQQLRRTPFHDAQLQKLFRVCVEKLPDQR